MQRRRNTRLLSHTHTASTHKLESRNQDLHKKHGANDCEMSRSGGVRGRGLAAAGAGLEAKPAGSLGSGVLITGTSSGSAATDVQVLPGPCR